MFFSIIIPFRDTIKNLNNCLYSIKNQNFYNYEVYVIDDGSGIDLKRYFLKKYKKTKLIVNKFNRGVSYSRNKGIIKSKGKYIVFIDSDDLLSENFLSNAYQKLKHNNCDFLYIDSKNFKTNKVNFNFIDQQNKNDFFLKKITNFERFKIHSWNYIIKSNIVKKNLFLNNLKFYEDQVFISNILLKKYKSICLKNTYIIRNNENPNSLGRSVGAGVINTSIFCLKYFESLKCKSKIDKNFIKSRINFYLKEILKNLFYLNDTQTKEIKLKLFKILNQKKYKLHLEKKFNMIKNYKQRILNDNSKYAVIYCFGQLGRIVFNFIRRKYKKLYIIDNNPSFNKRIIQNQIIYCHKDFIKRIKIKQKFTLYVCHENLKMQSNIIQKFNSKENNLDSMKFNFF